MSNLKTCKVCGKEKEASIDNWPKGSAGYLKRTCRTCWNKKQRQYYEKHKDKRKLSREKRRDELNSKRRQRYAEDVNYRQRVRDTSKKWKEKNSERILTSHKNDHPAVYEIKNLKTGKVYIGESIGYKRRISQHKSQLRGGYHKIRSLQEDWDKFGEDSFDFQILYGNDDSTKKDIYRKETEIIQKLVKEGSDLYNFEKKII